ncbi:DivIVA domain-containing protein [Micromonospora sp. PLK6-60]|uniref:DivIVA domain-containing protein n=1 Tax=Micromonospora sp. PLK6-60 TaxID=2873383 RepID=UPI001CA72E2D|nr:DivIVA domain-containing protein [Micromonospora sp. PLK6-60]MBY8871790.1 DivIVA domain-containing protein [Micromonospora sp. PLK6-60]
MRNLLRRLTRRPDAPQPAPTSATNRAPLRPWQVRERCFNVRRHGLDPAEIRAFLHRVADDLAVAQTALVAVQEENVRIKNALRDWQSAQPANRRYR